MIYVLAASKRRKSIHSPGMLVPLESYVLLLLLENIICYFISETVVCSKQGKKAIAETYIFWREEANEKKNYRFRTVLYSMKSQCTFKLPSYIAYFGPTSFLSAPLKSRLFLFSVFICFALFSVTSDQNVS